MYATLTDDEKIDRERLERELDAPLPDELTPEQRRRREMARIADANRAGLAALDRSAGMARP